MLYDQYPRTKNLPEEVDSPQNSVQNAKSSQDRFQSQFSFHEINFPNNWENGVEFG